MFLCLVKLVAIVKKVNEFQVAIGAPEQMLQASLALSLLIMPRLW